MAYGDNISRQQAIDALNDAVHEHNITDFDAIATILALPPVTPKQRTGKWINGKCDKCGEHAPFYAMASTYHESNFCPNCGADMRGERDDSV